MHVLLYLLHVYLTICICTLCFTFFEGLDENSSVVRLQSGVVLEKLDSHLAEHGLMVPLDLGAKGSCQLGGNVSTNAGGLRLLRYYLYKNVITYTKYFRMLCDSSNYNTDWMQQLEKRDTWLAKGEFEKTALDKWGVIYHRIIFVCWLIDAKR